MATSFCLRGLGVVLASLTLLLGGSTALADKTLTIKTLTAAHLTRIVLEPAGTVLNVCATYQLKDQAGVAVGSARFFCQLLTPAQTAAFFTFLTVDAQFLLGANTNEGL